MISTLRSYRTLPVLFATLLVVSVSLPLVRYACGATGAAMTMLAPAAHGVSDGTALCAHGDEPGHEPVRAALCTDADASHAGCEDGAACTVQSERRASALNVEAPSVRLHSTPGLAVTPSTVPLIFAPRPAAARSDDAGGVQNPVPIRLRTATLLL